jgi:hypothetical protein
VDRTGEAIRSLNHVVITIFIALQLVGHQQIFCLFLLDVDPKEIFLLILLYNMQHLLTFVSLISAHILLSAMSKPNTFLTALIVANDGWKQHVVGHGPWSYPSDGPNPSGTYSCAGLALGLPKKQTLSTYCCPSSTQKAEPSAFYCGKS